MQFHSCFISAGGRGALRMGVTGLILALGMFPPAAPGAETGFGVISGTVSNTATGNLLEGARVEVPRRGLLALTDNTGRFVLHGLPAGSHELVVSYTGLDTQRRAVAVADGQRATRSTST